MPRTKRINSDTFLQSALSGLPEQFTAMSLPRSSIEMKILSDMVIEDNDRIQFDKISNQCLLMMATFTKEVDISPHIYQVVKAKSKEIVEFFKKAPNFRTFLSFDKAFRFDNIQTSLEALIERPPGLELDKHHVYSLFACINSLYESANDIRNNIKKVNTHYKKAHRLNIDQILSISDNAYKKYGYSDSHLIRNCVDHEDYHLDFEKQTITFYMSTKNKNRTRTPLGELTMSLFEFFHYVMKLHSTITVIRTFILINIFISSLCEYYGK